MPRGWGACVLWLSAAACNSLYGLDKTVLADGDTDGDLVPDDEDNCPLIANGDQADADGDGRGDACDGCDDCKPCDRGGDHDEDGDRVADGCDNCPALANADQTNGDGDELGDACDESAAFERRLFFAGFDTLGDDWLQGGGRWSVTADDVGPSPETMPGVTATLQPAMASIPSGTRWAIEVGLVPSGLDRRQVLFVGDSGYCMLVHQGDGTWKLNASATMGAPFAATFGSTIRMRMTPTGQVGAQHVTCTIPSAPPTSDTLLELIYPLQPKLATSDVDVKFRYLELIGE